VHNNSHHFQELESVVGDASEEICLTAD